MNISLRLCAFVFCLRVEFYRFRPFISRVHNCIYIFLMLAFRRHTGSWAYRWKIASNLFFHFTYYHMIFFFITLKNSVVVSMRAFIDCCVYAVALRFSATNSTHGSGQLKLIQLINSEWFIELNNFNTALMVAMNESGPWCVMSNYTLPACKYAIPISNLDCFLWTAWSADVCHVCVRMA